MGRKVPSHLVVLGHPGSSSFNTAVAGRFVEAVRATHQDAVMRDLYAMEFDPLPKENDRTSNDDGASSDVQAELDLLQQCDVLTFAYPLWFGMPPTIITRYIDRVLGAGFRVDDLKRSPEGVLRGKRLAVITTSGSKLSWLEEHGMWCRFASHSMSISRPFLALCGAIITMRNRLSMISDRPTRSAFFLRSKN